MMMMMMMMMMRMMILLKTSLTFPRPPKLWALVVPTTTWQVARRFHRSCRSNKVQIREKASNFKFPIVSLDSSVGLFRAKKWPVGKGATAKNRRKTAKNLQSRGARLEERFSKLPGVTQFFQNKDQKSQCTWFIQYQDWRCWTLAFEASHSPVFKKKLLIIKLSGCHFPHLLADLRQKILKTKKELLEVQNGRRSVSTLGRKVD